MLQDHQAANQSWRKHWFVVNVLIDIPILGSFFKKKTLPGAMYAAGKCVAAIAGGTAGMMTILVPNETDSTLTQAAKMSTSMIIGMTAGKVIYNGACNSGLIVYQYLKSKSDYGSSVSIDDAEMQHITAEIEHPNIARNKLEIC